MFHFSVQDPIPCNKQFKINYRKKRFSKFTTGLELSIILIITRKIDAPSLKTRVATKKKLAILSLYAFRLQSKHY